HDVSAKKDEPDIGEQASRLSALGPVRARMRELQRAAGADGGVVMEGRDIGTAIFPDAEFKFFLDADVKTRARRRFEELKRKGASITEPEVLAQLVERDRRDSGRELAPLRRADDATEIDSTKLSVEAVLAAMKAKINARINAAKDLKRA
ncbi:MAG: (d)CMP kinase, partial [Candidatus Binatus sp.]